MKSTPNSSRSYWVTRPEGNTRQDLPPMFTERVGMRSVHVHFNVETRRVDDRVGRLAVCMRQRFGIRGFKELDERAGQRLLLEQPVMTAGCDVVRLHRAYALAKSLTVGRRHDGVSDRERARHVSDPPDTSPVPS